MNESGLWLKGIVFSSRESDGNTGLAQGCFYFAPTLGMVILQKWLFKAYCGVDTKTHYLSHTQTQRAFSFVPLSLSHLPQPHTLCLPSSYPFTFLIIFLVAFLLIN